MPAALVDGHDVSVVIVVERMLVRRVFSLIGMTSASGSSPGWPSSGCSAMMVSASVKPGQQYALVLLLARLVCFSLIQLEGDILSRGVGTNTGDLSSEKARKFLASFENYIGGREAVVDTNLVAVLAWTYSNNDTAKGSWAPRWFTGGRASANNLAANTGIDAGLDDFQRNATNGLQTFLEQWSQISSLRDSVRSFVTCEAALVEAARSRLEDKFNQAEPTVEKARQDLDLAVGKAAPESVFAGGVSLANAQRQFNEALSAGAGAAFNRIWQVNESALAANKDYPLFKEIKTRLEAIRALLSSQVSELAAGGDLKEFQRLDDTCLAENTFRKRSDLYRQARQLMDANTFANDNLVGAKGQPLAQFLTAKIGALREEAARYSGPLTNEFGAAFEYKLKLVEQSQSKKFFRAYLDQANILITSMDGFPLTSDLKHRLSAADFQAAAKTLKSVSEDLSSPVFTSHAPRDLPRWTEFASSIANQQMVAKALIGDDGVLGACTFTLPGSSDGSAQNDFPWRDVKLIVNGTGNEAVRTGLETDQKLGDSPVQQHLELRLIQNANDPGSKTFPIPTSEWGPLELLHKYPAERDKTDPRTWLLTLPAGMTANGAKASLRLKLRFESMLPELDKWPKS